MALIQPLQGSTDYTDIISIISIYSNYNLNLVLSIGLPLPSWMTVTGSDYLIMPFDDGSWDILRQSLASATFSLINALWNSPAVSRQWMASHFYIEGFSEFDALLNVNWSTSSSTPVRAAFLQNSIQYLLDYYGLPINTLMPSVIGNYNGRAQFISDYYAYGGSGLPNVHIYNSSSTYNDSVNSIRSEVSAIAQVLPSSRQGQLVIGETGHSDITPPYCPAGSAGAMDPGQRAYEYAAIAEDSYINANAGVILFWRLMDFDPQQTQNLSPNCEPFFGVVPVGGPYYNNVGLNLFSYLKQ